MYQEKAIIPIFADKSKVERSMNLNLDSQLVFALMNGKVADAFVCALQRGFMASQLKLTPQQWVILVHLDLNEGITQSELSVRVGETKPFISRTMSAMERERLIYREVDEHDSRAKCVFLTPRGLAVRERAQMIALRTLRHCFKGISIEHLSIAQDTMRCIYENTNRYQ